MPTLPFHPVIELAFDPIVSLGDWHVRLQTIGLAVVIFVALLLAARIAARTPVDTRRPPEAIDPATGDHNHLRRDDLLYIAVAALPGAVVGGRLGWALVHLEYVTANPGALLDPTVGGFGLPLAVVGGTLTAALVATLLDTPIPRWLHALILPLLFGIAGGKLAMVLGGDGAGHTEDHRELPARDPEQERQDERVEPAWDRRVEQVASRRARPSAFPPRRRAAARTRPRSGRAGRRGSP